MSTVSDPCEASADQATIETDRTGPQVTWWRRLVPEDQASVAVWLAITFVVLAAVQFLTSGAAANVPTRYIEASYYLAPAARLLATGLFLWLARTRFRAPASIVGLVVLSAVAHIVTNLVSAIPSLVATLDAAANVALPTVLASFVQPSAEPFAMLVIAFAALLVMWKREQARQWPDAEEGAPGPWRSSVGRFADALGIGPRTDAISRGLLLGVIAINLSTAVVQEGFLWLWYLRVPSSSAGPFGNLMLIAIPVVSLLAVTALAFRRFHIPVAAWLPLSARYASTVVWILVYSVFQLVVGQNGLAYAWAMAGALVLFPVQIAAIAGVAWWATSSRGARPGRALPVGEADA